MAIQELVKPEQEERQYSDENFRVVLDFSGIIDFTDDQLFEFCVKNNELQIERDKEGKIIIMTPIGGAGSERESSLNAEFVFWNKKYKLGKVFSPSCGFILKNKAMRAPDVSFITNERWEALAEEEQEKFLPLCPDFVVELISKSDRLKDLQEKMEEWMKNDCPLGWLIDPYEEKAYIYRPGKEVEIVDSFDKKLSGENVLPNFELELKEFRSKKK